MSGNGRWVRGGTFFLPRSPEVVEAKLGTVLSLTVDCVMYRRCFDCLTVYIIFSKLELRKS